MALYSVEGGLLASQVACFVGLSAPEHSPCTALSHKVHAAHHRSLHLRLSGKMKSSMTMTQGPAGLPGGMIHEISILEALAL